MKKDITKKHQQLQHDLLKKEKERILSLMVDETSYYQYIDRLYEIHNKMNELEEKNKYKIMKSSSTVSKWQQKLDQLKGEQRKLFLNKPSSTSPEHEEYWEKIYALENKITILERKIEQTKEPKPEIITLTVSILKNFTFYPKQIRYLYPELDEQGIEDDDIVGWLMDNYEGDILESNEEGTINDFYVDSQIDDYWSTSTTGREDE